MLMMMMMTVRMMMSLPTLVPFRTGENSNEVTFIKLLGQGLGIVVKELTVLLWKQSQERHLTICEVVLLWGPEIVRVKGAQKREIYKGYREGRMGQVFIN